MSLGNFLRKQDLSRKAITVIKHRGGIITVNNEKQTTRCLLSEGDEVSLTFPKEKPKRTLAPVKMALNVVYEDDFILVVDKAAGMPSVPTGHHEASLANGILAHYEATGLASAVHFVNRLDKNTSGLLLVAKYRHIHHLLTTDPQKIVRKYYALVAGVLKDGGVIDAKIHRPSVTSVKRVVDETGQHARTHYEPVQTTGASTLVRCTLETGRTHQIRVHLSHIGHPILKDPLYGDGAAGDRQLLHSYFLGFTHPITGEQLSFETDVPARFEGLE